MQTEPLDILIVEDNAAQAHVLREALGTSGLSLQLQQVTTLAAALDAAASRPVDLVLLDLGLPDSFGVETVRRMYQAAPDIPIVVLTGLTDEEVAVEAVRQGAQDYIEKGQLNGRMLGRVIRYAVERARSERQILQANERFRLAASAAHEIIYDWDLPNGSIFRSEGLTRVLGISPESASPTRDWWLARVHPDDTAALDRQLKTALESESTFIAEYRVRHRDGHYVNIWDRGVIVRDTHGRPIRIVGGQLDVTQRIRAEEEMRRTNETLRAFIKSSPLAIITLDRAGRVTSWNPAAEELFGYKEREVMGRDLPIVPEQSRAEFQRLLARDLQGKSRRGHEVKRIRKDGTLVDISTSTAPIRDAAGHVVAVMSILEDITQRKKSDEERARLQEQLHQTQKLEAVGQLAAGVAHDFNNLLTVILGNIDRLNKLLASHGEQRTVLTMIEDAARQASGVTRSLLTFSHKIPSVKRQTNLTTAIEESARLLQRLLPTLIDLQVDVPPEPIWVLADRSQLQQVVLNLAINARDAMPEGGTLRLSLARSDARRAGGNGLAYLEISDTGSGIPPDVQPHIFDPFFTTKPRGQGTGLGLAIVRSIVEDHQGEIRVDTRPSKGSTFTITLPTLANEPGEERPESTEEVPRGKDELLLLAEDNAYVREVVASALRSFGYRIVEASDGGAALEEHERRPGEFAAFVFDHEMPRRTGIQCLREIRRRGDPAPAIITSGSFGTDVENEQVENTILLRKPFQMKELARVLANVLHAREPTA
jgi:PAS domain S-box-containing protein